MPNWVYNNVEMSGPADVIQQLIADKFDFLKISPPPKRAGEKWYSKHWTADRNCDTNTFSVKHPEIDGMATVSFRTAWSTPYALFAFLTKKFNGLRLVVHYQGDACAGFEGRTEYAEGQLQDVFIDVSKHSGGAMREFKRQYPWFDYDMWEQLEYFGDEEGDGRYECLERSSTYEELIA